MDGFFSEINSTPLEYQFILKLLLIQLQCLEYFQQRYGSEYLIITYQNLKKISLLLN